MPITLGYLNLATFLGKLVTRNLLSQIPQTPPRTCPITHVGAEKSFVFVKHFFPAYRRYFNLTNYKSPVVASLAMLSTHNTSNVSQYLLMRFLHLDGRPQTTLAEICKAKIPFKSARETQILSNRMFLDSQCRYGRFYNIQDSVYFARI